MMHRSGDPVVLTVNSLAQLGLALKKLCQQDFCISRTGVSFVTSLSCPEQQISVIDLCECFLKIL